jgi:membrane fusion protein (multidrug efflux system)
VPGTVSALFVDDNQFVRKGEILVDIDGRDYAVGVREARSAFEAEQAKKTQLATQVDVAVKQLQEYAFRKEAAAANLQLQEANLRQAGDDLQRARKLFERSIIPEAQREKAQTVYDVASAQVEAARKQLRQAEAAVQTQRSMIAQAEAAFKTQGSVVAQKGEALHGEELRLSYTRLISPAEGYIAKRTVEVGNQIQAGQPLMAVVPLDDVWIVANYKETQIGRIQPGQSVKIEVDGFPGRTFVGTVDSIMAGSGSVFSLFPPENATGNYVKVVQRIPVKILLDKKSDPHHVLRVGMSVVPTVLVEK